MKYAIPAALVLTLLIGPVALSQQKKEASATPPEIMRLYIGGYFGHSFEVTYDGRDLRYYTADGMTKLKEAKPVIIKADDKAWQAFAAALDDIGVWTWKDRYQPEGGSLPDGTSWSVAIVYGGLPRHVLVTTGIGDKVRPEKFVAFLKAVSTLVDNKDFK